jgi:hypothetical protein
MRGFPQLRMLRDVHRSIARRRPLGLFPGADLATAYLRKTSVIAPSFLLQFCHSDQLSAQKLCIAFDTAAL